MVVDATVMTPAARAIFAPRSLWIGVDGPLTSRLAESLGAAALWVSSYAVSANLKAVPDASIVTASEMLETARRICLAAPSTGVVVDCDTGYGDADLFARIVREYCLTSGVSALCIEDKVFPKRNSFYNAAQVMEDPGEFALKIRAAISARDAARAGVALVARTEALVAGDDPQEALDRAHMYADAGADAVMFQSSAPLSALTEVLQRWSAESAVPAVVAPLRYPDRPAGDMWEAGARCVIYANQLTRVGLTAQAEFLKAELAAAGSRPIALEGIWSMADVNSLVGVREARGAGAAKRAEDREPGQSRTN